MRTPFSSPRFRSFLWSAGALYAVVWFLCLFPFFRDGVLPGSWTDDTNTCFIPYRAYLVRSVQSLNFPDLAEGEFFGQPMMTYGQPMLLYPTTLAGLIIPLPHVPFFLLDLWVHAGLASLGCAWLLRRRGAGAATALVLGWVYPNTTTFLFRACAHWTMLHQAALIPWVVVGWETMDRIRRGRVLGPAAWMSIAIALLLMCRTPHWPYLLAVTLVPLEALRTFRRRTLIRPMRRAGVFLLLAGAAVVLAAPDVFSPFLALKNSFRAAGSHSDLSLFYPLSRFNLIGLISPYVLFGNSLHAFFGNWWPQESVSIAGRGVFLLSVAGLASLLVRPKRFLGKGALPLVFIVAGLAFGGAPEIRWLRPIFDHLPLYPILRAWGRAGLLIVLGMILLAGMGLDRLAGKATEGRRIVLRTLPVALAIVAFLLWIRSLLGGEVQAAVRFLVRSGWHSYRLNVPTVQLINTFDFMRRHLLIDVVWYAVGAGILVAFFFLGAPRARRTLKAVILILLIIEAGRFQRFIWSARTQPLIPEAVPALMDELNQLRASEGNQPITVAFRPHELSNFGLQLEGVRSLSGTDSNMPAAYAYWLNKVQGRGLYAQQLESQLNTFPKPMLDVTGLVSVVDVDKTNSQGPSSSPPRSYGIVERFPPRPYVEIVGQQDPTSGSDSGTTRTSPTVEVASYQGDVVQLNVQAADSVVLRIREFDRSGWRARLNGKSLSLERTNHNLYLHLPPGGGQVILKYVDLPARVFVGISLLAWGVAIGIVLWRRRGPNG